MLFKSIKRGNETVFRKHLIKFIKNNSQFFKTYMYINKSKCSLNSLKKRNDMELNKKTKQLEQTFLYRL